MSDSEDDYMSAAFLDVKEDIRPGLVHSSTLKRKYENEKKAIDLNSKRRTKPLRVVEEEHRNAGLDTALSSDNKGFLMLQKMGYKPGMKLGAQKDSSNLGLTEPIRVKVKSNRGGLGAEEEIRRKIAETEKKRAEIKVWKEHETAKLTEEFRQRMKDKVTQKHLMSDLNKIRKVCEQLDVNEGVEEPMRSWFWFSSLPEKDDDDDDDNEYAEEDHDEELGAEDQLYFINDYLRSKYFYCVWCGTQFTNEEDMSTNCPGSEKEDHE